MQGNKKYLDFMAQQNKLDLNFIKVLTKLNRKESFISGKLLLFVSIN